MRPSLFWLELSVYCKKARLAQHGGVQSGVQGPDDFLINLFLVHGLGPAKFSRPALAVTDSDNPLEHVPPLSPSPML